MLINRNNYETFLIDYIDGNLKPIEVAELLLFLEQNPDIKSEFEGIENFSFVETSFVNFPEKEALKRRKISATFPHKEFFQNLLFRKIEKELTLEEEKQFQKLVTENGAFHKEFLLFQKTILKPDYSIVFTDKKWIKKQVKIIPLYYKISAIAALFILFFSISFLVTNFKNTNTSRKKITTLVPTTNGDAVSFPQIKQDTLVLAQDRRSELTNKDLSAKKLKIERRTVSKKNRSSLPGAEQVLSLAKENNSIAVATDSTLAERNESALAEMPTLTLPLVPQELKVAEPQFLSFNDIVKKKIKSLSKENLEENGSMKSSSNGGKITLWDIAGLCAHAISKVSGEKIKVQNKYDSEGELKQYAILSENFEFSKTR